MKISPTKRGSSERSMIASLRKRLQTDEKIVARGTRIKGAKSGNGQAGRRPSGTRSAETRASGKGAAGPRAFGTGAVRLGIGDDCAILRIPPGQELLLTTDMSLETIHFRRDWHNPEAVGHRCLARGLSDIAAMGGKPIAAFLSLALPAELTLPQRGRGASWRDRFWDGLLALAREHGVPLAGGDTAQSPRDDGRFDGLSGAPARNATRPRKTSSGLALADIVLVGSAPKDGALRRSTAQAGDLIYVTGQLGGAAAELAALAAQPERFAKLRANTHASGANRDSGSAHPHLFPQPRIAVGEALRRRGWATAAIDLSDGLSTDLEHLCQESGLSAVIDAKRLPIHQLAATAESPLELALHGGEDYELLFTAGPRTRVPRRIAGVEITQIGEMQARKPGRPRVQLLVSKGTSGTKRSQDTGKKQCLRTEKAQSLGTGKKQNLDMGLEELRPGGWEHFTS